MKFIMNKNTQYLIDNINSTSSVNYFVRGNTLVIRDAKLTDIYFTLVLDNIGVSNLVILDSICNFCTYVGVIRAEFQNTSANHSDFRNIDFTEWGIYGSDLSNGLFLGSKNLHAASSSFSSSMMRGVNFIKELDECNMDGAMMLDCDFSACKVSDCTFNKAITGSHAYLQNAVFDDVSRSEFNGAFLYEATINGKDCIFNNATLIGANIKIASEHTQADAWKNANIQLAKFDDDKTKDIALQYARC